MTELLVIPLFPHYAMSSYESAVERVKEVAAKLAPKMRLQIQAPYYAAPELYCSSGGKRRSSIYRKDSITCCLAFTVCPSDRFENLIRQGVTV